jgi:hypothetical protein
VATLVLTACGGGGSESTTPESSAGTTTNGGSTSNGGSDDGGDESTASESEPEPTMSPADQFPEALVIHPEAFDLEANEASNTYVYIVPMMVGDTTEYLLEELQAQGWEELGQPTIMGHLATLNMKNDTYRLTISMQDNERSETTRVQMVLMEQ